jgi:chromate transporter
LGIALPIPFFSINMVALMLMTFFIICFVGSSKSKVKFCAAFMLAGLYALANGKAGVLQQWSLSLLISMVGLATASILYDSIRKKGEKPEKGQFKFDFKLVRSLLLFVLIAIVFTAITYLVSQDGNVLDFAGKVVSSSLTSFGGGEVYIGISETTFVQTGFIPEHIYNTQIIGIANTMPGPVLMAIVTGIGYTYGSIQHGIAYGWLVSLLGLTLAVTVTAVGALSLSICFELLKDSRRLQTIIQFIMPVVCGMLISTALSLINQASSVLIDVGVNSFLGIGIVLAIFLVMRFLHKKYHMNDLLLLFLGGFGTLAALSIVF